MIVPCLIKGLFGNFIMNQIFDQEPAKVKTEKFGLKTLSLKSAQRDI